MTRYEDALRVYKEISRTSADDVWATCNQLGHLNQCRGQYGEAEEWYRKATLEDPENATAFNFLGEIQRSQGKLREAEATFRQAAQCPEGFIGQSYYNLGLVLRDQRQLAEAAECFGKALKHYPKHEEANEALADITRALAHERDIDPSAIHNSEGITCVLRCERWLRDHPTDSRVRLTYANALAELGQYKQAIQAFVELSEDLPLARWATFSALGHINDERGRYQEAEDWYRKATDEAPDRAGPLIFLGAIRALQGKLQEAEQTHRQATHCQKGDIDEAFHNVGLVLRGQWRLAEAAESFRKALDICPEYNEAQEALDDVTRARGLQKDDRLFDCLYEE